MTIPDDALAALAEAVGPGGLLTGEAIPARNRKDASKAAEGLPAALVTPRTTEEVAAVLSICSRLSLPVVVQGGMTGLAGGASPQAGEVALSLERMSGVEEIDPVNRTMTVFAGTRSSPSRKRRRKPASCTASISAPAGVAPSAAMSRPMPAAYRCCATA